MRSSLPKKWSDARQWAMGILAAAIVTVGAAFFINPVHDALFGPTVPLPLQQELAKLRDVLSQTPRSDRLPPGRYPPVDESGRLAKWLAPSKATTSRIVTLAELNPTAVGRALIPLLSDADGVVVEGALLALRDILVTYPRSAVALRGLLPRFDPHWALNLREAHIHDEDFTIFQGTEIFYSADMRGAVIEDVRFDRVQMTYADFSHAIVLNCSFKNATLTQSRWDESRVRASTFEQATMHEIEARHADFGVASSARDTFFGSNLFFGAELSDANLQDASMVGARLDGAQLHSSYVSGVDFTDARMGHEGDTEVSPQSLSAAGATLPILRQDPVKYGRRH
jgi:uncharacterized protein YjbI with pentapeptide repeats